jgi:cytochrome c-type biogenesis protein CcmH/NrfF
MFRAEFMLPAAFVLCALIAQPGIAAEGVPTEMDPVNAARAVKLADKLRCLVCQNQTIDSNAELQRLARSDRTDRRGQDRREILPHGPAL